MNVLTAVRVALLTTGATVFGCTGGDGERAVETPSGPPAVMTGNYPLAYFAERIGAELVTVGFPAPAEVDPAFWKPEVDVLRRYQQADVILMNGAGYEGWASNVSLPLAGLIDTSKPFADRLIETGADVTHSHGPGAEHTHTAKAFTTWLDPILAIAQAREVHRGLLRELPEQEDALDAGFAALERDLAELDRSIEAAVAQGPHRALLGSHPVYQYLQRRYELNLRSLHWEPDEPPTAEQWAELDALQAEHGARWMLWEGEPAAETARLLGERGVTCLVFDPCGNAPDEGDFLTVMRANAAALATAFAD